MKLSSHDIQGAKPQSPSLRDGILNISHFDPGHDAFWDEHAVKVHAFVSYSCKTENSQLGLCGLCGRPIVVFSVAQR
jgi:hypothetical protein